MPAMTPETRHLRLRRRAGGQRDDLGRGADRVRAQAGHRDQRRATAYRLFLGRSMAAVEDMLRERLCAGAVPRPISMSIRTETFRAFPRRAEADARYRRGAVAAECGSLRGVVERAWNASGFRCRSPACWKCWSRIYTVPRWWREASRRPTSSCMPREEMGVRPEDCVVVEDSPAGIDAAQARGHARLRLHRRLACRAGRAGSGARGAAARPDLLRHARGCPTSLAEVPSRMGGRAG